MPENTPKYNENTYYATRNATRNKQKKWCQSRRPMLDIKKYTIALSIIYKKII